MTLNLDIDITNNGNMCELTELMTSPDNLIDTQRTVGKPGKFLTDPKKHEKAPSETLQKLLYIVHKNVNLRGVL